MEELFKLLDEADTRLRAKIKESQLDVGKAYSKRETLIRARMLIQEAVSRLLSINH